MNEPTRCACGNDLARPGWDDRCEECEELDGELAEWADEELAADEAPGLLGVET